MSVEGNEQDEVDEPELYESEKASTDGVNHDERGNISEHDHEPATEPHMLALEVPSPLVP